MRTENGSSSTNPVTSSLVVSPGENLPDLSPIEAEEKAVRDAGVASPGVGKEMADPCKKLFSLSPQIKEVKWIFFLVVKSSGLKVS